MSFLPRHADTLSSASCYPVHSWRWESRLGSFIRHVGILPCSFLSLTLDLEGPFHHIQFYKFNHRKQEWSDQTDVFIVISVKASCPAGGSANSEASRNFRRVGIRKGFHDTALFTRFLNCLKLWARQMFSNWTTWRIELEWPWPKRCYSLLWRFRRIFNICVLWFPVSVPRANREN